MGYSAIKGRRPLERASKITHTDVIKNPAVQEFLASCESPPPPDPASVANQLVPIPQASGRIRAVVAVDGGMTETFVQDDFPSASITFMTFGPLMLELDDLGEVDEMRFIGPEDMARLKNFQRYVAVVPTHLVAVNGTASFSAGVRKSIHQALLQGEGELQGALRWLLFREWLPKDRRLAWTINQCPRKECDQEKIDFDSNDADTKKCPGCGHLIFLSDALRLHERIDDDLGAAGIMGYLLTTLEHLTIVRLIRYLWNTKRELLREVLFIKDGPLAFFGNTAPLRKPMLELMKFLGEQVNGCAINLVGLEKSGAFVEHAAQIETAFGPRQALVLNNEYIRTYIVPGDPTSTQPYGENMYFGGKIIFKGEASEMYVATVPLGEFKRTPSLTDFYNLGDVLRTTSRLRCSMYDNALMPVALVNRMVSLADVPTSDILSKFARDRLSGRLP
ncbi:MAG: NurA domain-containing protein [Polyangiaceae bacterium]